MDLTSMLSGSLRLSATGAADPHEVWDRYTRPARWAEWSPHLREVDYPDAVIRPGTTGRVLGVGGVVAVFRIDAVDYEARTWSWSVRSGPLRVSFDHGVDAIRTDAAAADRAWTDHTAAGAAVADPPAADPPHTGAAAADHAAADPPHAAASTAWLVTHALWPVAVGYAPLARLALARLVAPTSTAGRE